MWPLEAETSILWLLIPLAIGLLSGWSAWRGRGSLFGSVIYRRPAMSLAAARASMPLRVVPEEERIVPDASANAHLDADEDGDEDGEVMVLRAHIDEAAKAAPAAAGLAGAAAGVTTLWPARAAAAVETAGEGTAGETAGEETIARSAIDGAPDNRATIDHAPATDDLTAIHGIGPRIAAALEAMGVTRFAQIAGWDAAERARIDGELWGFGGRIAAERWSEQAALLRDGDHAIHAERFAGPAA